MPTGRTSRSLPAILAVAAMSTIPSLASAAAQHHYRIACRNTSLCGGGGVHVGHKLASDGNYVIVCRSDYCGGGGKH